MSEVERTLLSYAVVGAECEVHRNHKPMYSYCERHHIVPQAWQAVFVPPTFVQRKDDNWPFAALSPDHTGLFLWDARTVDVCRTGHGNVHFWLVKLMHILHDTGGDEKGLHAATVQLKHEMLKANQRIPLTEIDISCFAINRFSDSGGQLKTLWEARQYGAI